MSRYVIGWVVLNQRATAANGLAWLARCRVLRCRPGAAELSTLARVQWSEGGRAWPTLAEAWEAMRAEQDRLGGVRLEHCVVDLMPMGERADGAAVVAAALIIGVVAVGEAAWMVPSPARVAASN